MANTYTHKNLADVEDSAPKFGMEGFQARFAYDEVDAQDTGFSMFTIEPGTRMPFGHRHDKAEEVYVIVSGSGRAKLDGDIIELAPRDAVRVSPGVTRCFEAGADGLEYIAFGPRHEGDGEVVPGWWND